MKVWELLDKPEKWTKGYGARDELGKDFLQSIQNLHDGGGFWGDYGLTLNGKRSVMYILELYIFSLNSND